MRGEKANASRCACAYQPIRLRRRQIRTDFLYGSKYPLPEGSELLQDLGFVGFTLAGIQITQPHKKPRKKTLTEEQKAENRMIAHRRIRIEHIICSIKRCRIIKDTIRLWKDTARDMVMAICCGLHNFRLRLKPWPAYQ